MLQVQSNSATQVTPDRRGRCYSLSPSRDIPLLRLVRDSTFITRSQVEKLLPMPAMTESWKNRSKRIRRLVQLGQLDQLGQLFPFPGQAYAITIAGLSTLEAVGYGIHSVSSETGLPNISPQALHYLGLNEVRSSLQSVYKVQDWYGDRVLKSLNILAPNPTAKDYDSVAVVQSERTETPLRLGIEYERTIKSQARYAEIRKLLDTEKQIDALMYVTENPDTANIIASLVYSNSLPICTIDASEIAKVGRECTAFTVRERKVVRVPLKQFLPDLAAT